MVAGTWMLANILRGINQMQLCTMYKACVVPIMTYTSPIWWTGKETHRVKLKKVQNKALQHIAGAFRTTLVKALEVDLAILPIELTIGPNMPTGYTD